MRKKTSFIAIVVLALSTLVQGCGFLVGAAVGGTAGYLLKDEGYEVQTPVKRSPPPAPE
ncbi:hypothetical protein [Sedimenticola hydrogenitrophicus]|uniref:hypothetical protein n=1 Tax=Sedimenticola hydrogenitrophicus TaxID=2967975 RepID=UPI0023B0A5DC|nr:hypothetical protein [Sedimenticola hydrogenitrophicus]